MKQFILSLVAMTVIGTGSMSAQRNNNRHDEVRDSHRTEMRHDNNRKDVVVEKRVIVREAPRTVVAHRHHPVVVHETRRPVVVYHAPVPPRPVVVERHCSSSVGAVVAGAMVGAVLTSLLTN